MPRYKITIEYEGTNTIGWQKQKEGISIQEIIQKAIFQLSGQKAEIFGSGRTDAGVHALAQIAHFDLKKSLKPFTIIMGLNQHLKENNNVVITDCEIIDDNFHSRFDAKLRHYQYKILNRRAQPVLQKNRVWHIPYNLEIEKMQKASQYLIGKHDFSSFRDSQCQAKSAVKTIKNIKITKENDLILIDISAPSFLHHMVRNIVGTLVLVGGNKIIPEKIKEILQSKDRTKSGQNAPAYGLYLSKIDY